jgi:hypothetical protein
MPDNDSYKGESRRSLPPTLSRLREREVLSIAAQRSSCACLEEKIHLQTGHQNEPLGSWIFFSFNQTVTSTRYYSQQY